MLLAIVALFIGTILFNFLFQLAQLDLFRIYWQDVRRHGDGAPTPPLPDTLPSVTIQLPMYNESAVAERILDHAARIRYPRDRLQIQVLNDSTDGCTQIIERKIEELRRADPSLVIDYRHRLDRAGFKAGNLNAALPHVTGDLVAILDADFVPQPDFLEKTVPYFTDPQIGTVQTRWGHLNASDSVLTRTQEFYLDGHHSVEQRGRSAGNLYLFYNGSAGVWRTSVLRAVGGWRTDSVIEDIDMSFSAQVLGFRIRFLENYVTRGELPNSIIGFRLQMFRWFKGNMQSGIKFLSTVWRQKVSVHKKIHASLQLLTPFIPVSSLVNVLSAAILPLVLHLAPQYEPLMALSVVGLFWFPLMFLVYGSARLRFDKKPLWWTGLLMIPRALAFLALMVGLSCQCSVAIFEALFGTRNQWIVTPKGFSAATPGAPRKRTKMSIPWYFWLDLPIICYLAFGLSVAITYRAYVLILMESVFLGGYLWLFCGALWEAYGPLGPSRTSPQPASPSGPVLEPEPLPVSGPAHQVTAAG